MRWRSVTSATAIALTGDDLAFGTFELSGPGMVDRVQLAAMMGEALGCPIEAGEPSFDEWADATHLPEGPRREGLRRMYADYDEYGFPGGNALVLRAILGQEPRTLRQYVRELAERGAAPGENQR